MQSGDTIAQEPTVKQQQPSPSSDQITCTALSTNVAWCSWNGVNSLLSTPCSLGVFSEGDSPFSLVPLSDRGSPPASLAAGRVEACQGKHSLAGVSKNGEGPGIFLEVRHRTTRLEISTQDVTVPRHRSDDEQSSRKVILANENTRFEQREEKTSDSHRG
jgi:hypothetical protein